MGFPLSKLGVGRSSISAVCTSENARNICWSSGRFVKRANRLRGRSDAPSAPEIRIPRGAGGVGFLPLLMMEKNKLVEKHAAAAGISNLRVRWIELGGPSAMNDALLSGAVDFIAAGPPAFLVLWDRTRDSAKVMGVSAMTSLPMYLNTTNANLKRLEDVTEKDKITMTAIKV